MSKLAIKIESVSKKYKVYPKPYHRLFELLNICDKSQEICALNNITLNIERGRTTGIIGPNGSGKSTLLQIITGILQPTSGYLEVSGRISALLELGAGFNPEYTGRENIYLYSSILGVGKKEIDDKIDEIIQFAQIGDFIDRSVKTYSSGMYVRLAFAVAINVDPDILIVDEALAVGDESFQRKCFRKFEELKEKGVTILFVTHSLGLVKQFCDEAVLIYKGNLIEIGHPNKVINTYTKLISNLESGNSSTMENYSLEHQHNTSINENAVAEYRYGNGEGKIASFKICGENNNFSRVYKHGERITIELTAEYKKEMDNSVLAYTIKTISGVEVTGTNTAYEHLDLQRRYPGDSVTVTFVQNIALNAGDYVVSFGFVQLLDEKINVLDRRYDAITFKVAETKKSTGLVDPNATVAVEIQSRSENS